MEDEGGVRSSEGEHHLNVTLNREKLISALLKNLHRMQYILAYGQVSHGNSRIKLINKKREIHCYPSMEGFRCTVKRLSFVG